MAHEKDALKVSGLSDTFRQVPCAENPAGTAEEYPFLPLLTKVTTSNVPCSPGSQGANIWKANNNPALKEKYPVQMGK